MFSYCVRNGRNRTWQSPKMAHLTRVTAPEIIIRVDTDLLRWPTDDELEEDEPYFAGNRRYEDFRGFDWRDAIVAIRVDRDAMKSVQSGSVAEEVLRDQLGGSEFEGPPWGLDIGVAGAVAALSAFGAIPAASCNGGRLGAHHSYSHPLVAFFALPEMVAELMRCAEASGAGLTNSPNHDGTLLVFSHRLEGLTAFARHLIRRRPRS